MERYFEWANVVSPKTHELGVVFIVFESRWPAWCFLTLMAQLNALISLPQQVAGLIWKRSEPLLEKLSSGLNKPIKFYRYVENAPDFE